MISQLVKTCVFASSGFEISQSLLSKFVQLILRTFKIAIPLHFRLYFGDYFSRELILKIARQTGGAVKSLL